MAQVPTRKWHTFTKRVLLQKMFEQRHCGVLLEISLVGFTLSFWHEHVLHTPTRSWSIEMQTWTFNMQEHQILLVWACYK